MRNYKKFSPEEAEEKEKNSKKGFEFFFKAFFELDELFEERDDFGVVVFGFFAESGFEGGDSHDGALNHHLRDMGAGVVGEGIHFDRAPHHGFFHGIGLFEFERLIPCETGGFAADFFVFFMLAHDFGFEFFVLDLGQNVGNGFEGELTVSVNFR